MTSLHSFRKKEVNIPNQYAYQHQCMKAENKGLSPLKNVASIKIKDISLLCKRGV